ncbi:DNA topoisomerase 2, partial [Cladochytrium tenue]
MSKANPPVIKTVAKSEDFTRITFSPDLARFGMTHLDDDTVALLSKRAYDLAGCVRDIKVYLNDTRLKISTFKQYIDMYITAPETESGGAPPPKPTVIYEKIGDRWEVAATASTDGMFHQISFVNSICTSKGGTHVTYIADQLITGLTALAKKRDKKCNFKPNVVRSQLSVFVNCLIENPTFDSQTKENMTLKAPRFGSKCILSDEFVKKVANGGGVLVNVLAYAKFKTDQELKKTDGKRSTRISGISKLDDANLAGSRHGSECTLILTEGDSAKTLAVSGLSVVGRNNYGVFPLRGKLLNVRDATSNQIKANAEITALKQIIGLQQGKEYDTTSKLRYGHVMIMTDQGLGTSTAQDAKDYFSNMDLHRKVFSTINDDDRLLIDMAFNKKKADERKEWLRQLELGTFIDHNMQEIPMKDFINKELILFSQADCMRSIPSVVDGMKPGHRKILFSCFKRHLKSEIKVALCFLLSQQLILLPKVAQLGGYVGEHSAYHHGEQSLFSTIVGMAQNFVGSNNLNILEPRGQFGTRLQGGKDAASARYIFTALNPLARVVFHPEDDALLDYLNDDGQDIEPKYMPILPMILVNGSDGIGTGWSTSVPNY